MKRYTIVDAHCDTAEKMLDRGEPLLSNTGHLSLEMMKEYGGYVQFFAAWIAKEEQNPILRTLQMLDNLKTEIRKNKPQIEEIRSVHDLVSVLENGKCGAVLAIEDARALCGSLAVLRMYHELGVRAITLAWNDDNDVADGALSARGAGLTDFGKRIVREMNRLHMIVDVSHIAPKGFWDVLSISDAPVMASHSNCKTVCAHKRNLDDEQIRALIRKQGFIGLNLYPAFLENCDVADTKTILRHVEHILSLGGENSLGLGSDFDGVDALPKGIFSAREYTALFDEMARIGYSDGLIAKITHKNMINFMKRIEK